MTESKQVTEKKIEVRDNKSMSSDSKENEYRDFTPEARRNPGYPDYNGESDVIDFNGKVLELHPNYLSFRHWYKEAYIIRDYVRYVLMATRTMNDSPGVEQLKVNIMNEIVFETMCLDHIGDERYWTKELICDIYDKLFVEKVDFQITNGRMYDCRGAYSLDEERVGKILSIIHIDDEYVRINDKSDNPVWRTKTLDRAIDEFVKNPLEYRSDEYKAEHIELLRFRDPAAFNVDFR